MNAGKLVRDIVHWTKKYGFSDDVKVHRTDDQYVIGFTVRTTTTRASSIVTRMSLIVGELANGAQFAVGKELCSSRPRTREGLASWKIYTKVPILKKSSQRQELKVLAA